MRFFNRVSLPTPESVNLEFALAGIGNRALALLIDYHALGLLLAVFWIGWISFSIQLMSFLNQLNGDYSATPNWLLGIFLLANFAIFTGYFVYFEVFWQGQTPGKRLAKIRVIREDGRPIRMSQAALRALLRPVDDFLFLGVFFILLSQHEKRIGDMVAGTLVVQESSAETKTPLTVSDEAQQLATQLADMTQLDALRPDDFAVVRAYLQRRSSMAIQPRRDLSMQLARQLKTLIQLDTIPTGLTSDQFLEAIYLAYQNPSSRY